MLVEPFFVNLPILCFQEDVLLTVSTMGDVVRNPGDCDARDSGHLESPRP
jgi:hypothetical protein